MKEKLILGILGFSLWTFIGIIIFKIGVYTVGPYRTGNLDEDSLTASLFVIGWPITLLMIVLNIIGKGVMYLV